MSASSFNLANLLAILRVGRDPSWTLATDPHSTLLGAPDSTNDGVSLGNSPTTYLRVRLRNNPACRRALVTVGTLDTGATYTITINGTAITASTTPTSVDDLLVDAKAAILADATVGGAAGANQVVTAQCLDSDGEPTDGLAASGNAAVTLEVYGYNAANSAYVEDDFSISESATGTGDLDIAADAVTAGLRVWDTPHVPGSQTGASGWAQTHDTVGTGRGRPYARTVDYRGLSDRLDTAGKSRLYAELHSLTGAFGDDATITLTVAEVAIGPAILEAS